MGDPPPDDLRRQAAELVAEVQRFPYVWPAPPDAASARRMGAGSCSSKHALVAEGLELLGLECLPLLVVGDLVPESLSREPELAPGLRLLEVHECLTLVTPWAGPLRIDVTWDPPLVRRGLPGTLRWDGASDMLVAVGEHVSAWSVPRSELRSAKEALRARVYGPGERQVRDRVLAALSARFQQWRREG